MPILPDLTICLLFTAACLGIMLGIGCLLIPRATLEDHWQMQPVRLASGMVFLCGVIGTVTLGRFTYHSVIPLLQIAMSVWLWCRGSSGCAFRGGWLSLLMRWLGVLVGGFTFSWWWNMWWNADGRTSPLNMDLAYFAQMANGLREADVTSIWCATLGSFTRSSGETADLWYHWNPVWLTIGISKVTGQPAFNTLLFILAPVLNCSLIIIAGALVERLTGWSARWSLLVGGASLVALAFPSMEHVALLGKYMPFGAGSHVHTSLAYQFSYKCEAVLILAALHRCLARDFTVAIVLIFMAALCAPHSVAGVGGMAGTLACFAILRRDAEQFKIGVSSALAVLLAWAALHWGFGVGLPKTDSANLAQTAPLALLKNFGFACLDTLAGLLLVVPLIPGIAHLIRAKSASDARLLGWIAMSALVGSYFAYHLLMQEGERAHFTLFAHAFFVVPIGVWGLARLASQRSGVKRRWAIAGIAAVTSIGIYDMWGARSNGAPTIYSANDLAVVKAVIKEPVFGYFAKTDRNWWIPQHAMLAGLMDRRCVRLNKIFPLDEKSLTARFYGSSRPRDLVPLLTGESEQQWSLRFAAKLGIKHVLDMGDSAVPPELSNQLLTVLTVPGIRVLEIVGPTIGINKREPLDLLVIAPHPDDEVIGCAGVMLQALEQHKRVGVVMITSGDGYPALAAAAAKKGKDQLTTDDFLKAGALRQQHSVRAMARLGVPRDELVFLGYPDSGLEKIYRLQGDTPFQQPFTQKNETYGVTVRDYHCTVHGKPAPYLRVNVVADVAEIIKDRQPKEIYVTHDADTHSDHRTAFLFVRDAIQSAGYKGEFFTYVVHGAPPTEPPSRRVVLTKSQMETKRAAIQDHQVGTSPIHDRLADEYTKTEEHFWLGKPDKL